METMEQKTARNCRVQARYDELMREGKHGHYETMFRVVREEVEAARAAERERCAKLVETMDTTGHDGYIETTGDLCEALAACIRRA